MQYLNSYTETNTQSYLSHNNVYQNIDIKCFRFKLINCISTLLRQENKI